jgi:hypothetical protein
MIHTTVGVYRNGDHKSNGVSPDHLESHIQYNKDMRPGRALLVDGKVVHRGYYGEDEVPWLEKEFGHIRILTCTAPYH